MKCAYCGFSAWGEHKCLSCGAMPTQPKETGLGVKLEALYGFRCARPEMAARITRSNEVVTVYDYERNFRTETDLITGVSRILMGVAS